MNPTADNYYGVILFFFFLVCCYYDRGRNAPNNFLDISNTMYAIICLQIQ